MNNAEWLKEYERTMACEDDDIPCDLECDFCEHRKHYSKEALLIQAESIIKKQYRAEDTIKNIYERVSREEYNKALDELVQSLTEIDSCEFAMFSLCLVKEKAEELKK